MKLELSKVSHGLKIVGIVLVIIYLGVGSYVIDGGQNPVMERVSPLWKCTVASVVFDLAFLAFYALMIGASYKDNLPKVPPKIQMAILILGAILYFAFGVVFLHATTGTHWFGQLGISVSSLPGASKGHALGSMCLLIFLTMAIDAIVAIVVFMQPSENLPVATEEPASKPV